MSINDRQLRSLTVAKVSTARPAAPQASAGISKLFNHLKDAVTTPKGGAGAGTGEELLLLLTCDHIALVRGGDPDAAAATSPNASRRAPSSAALTHENSAASSVTSESASEQALVLSLALSHVTRVAADGAAIHLSFVTSAGLGRRGDDPLAPSSSFPVLSAIGARASGLLGSESGHGGERRSAGKQVTTLSGVAPLQSITLWADSEEVSSARILH